MKNILLMFFLFPFFVFAEENLYTHTEICDIIYKEYLFSLDVLEQFNPDDQFVNYMRGYSRACENLYYRINTKD